MPSSPNDILDSLLAGTDPWASATDPNAGIKIPKVTPYASNTNGLNYGNLFSNLSSVLGGAAKNQAASEQAADKTRLGYDQFNLEAPGERLKQATKAGFLQTATPYKAQWGGPGSGLKGQIVQMTGGLDPTKLPASVKQLAGQVQNDQLMAELGGPAKPTAGTSAGDKALGWGSVASSLLPVLLALL